MKPKNKHPEEKNAIILVSILIVLLVAQSIFLIIMGFQYSRLNNRISNELDSSDYGTIESLRLNDQELMSKINEISESLLILEDQMGDIKAQKNSDFSEIVQDSMKSVVTIKTDVSQGSGFIVSQNGYVITNAHVLSGARYAYATTFDKKNYRMSLVGYDDDLDIAVLKINASYPYFRFRDSTTLKVGEKVIAIGNPLGLSFSVSEGIISAVHRTGGNANLPHYIQTDASLNPGNSGGPLIDVYGRVIGINNFKARAENIGFALESNKIVEIVNDITSEKINFSIINEN